MLFIGHGMGTSNTVCFRSWVCMGMGMGMGLPYLCNTVPFSTVLWVYVGMPVLEFQSGE